MSQYISAVVAIIEQEGRILLGRKITKAGHGLSEAWHVPGGKVNGNESKEEALRREMKEETGLDITVEKLIDIKWRPEVKHKVYWYLCKVVGGELKPGSDLQAVRFFPKEQVEKVCDPKAMALWPPKVRKHLAK